MNTSYLIASYFQRASAHAAQVGVFAALLLVANAQAAVVSDFESGPDDWEAFACPNSAPCSAASPSIAIEHLTTGGNPGGYIRTRDPSSDSAARVMPPAKFRDEYALFQVLSFDALVERNGGDGVFDAAFAPLVMIEGTGGTLVYLTNDLPAIDELDGIEGNDWRHYDVLFVDLPEVRDWLIVVGDTIREPIGGEFEVVFGSQTRLTIISEWLNDSQELDTGGLDNVQLTALNPIPLPAALPLLMSALLGIGFTAKRRIRR